MWYLSQHIDGSTFFQKLQFETRSLQLKCVPLTTCRTQFSLNMAEEVRIIKIYNSIKLGLMPCHHHYTIGVISLSTYRWQHSFQKLQFETRSLQLNCVPLTTGWTLFSLDMAEKVRIIKVFNSIKLGLMPCGLHYMIGVMSLSTYRWQHSFQKLQFETRSLQLNCVPPFTPSTIFFLFYLFFLLCYIQNRVLYVFVVHLYSQ